ncbi:hypothetical protein DVA86_21715 [Streptomyces armeniacus]|uniref:Erythromycin biosynthesis protein CIII-like C-terminal domain-containing protein n=1 Tax=Streptomyces armeniacus TaxID=83291 RepID=A0A345XTA8_9ACTN|nr:nucleotide disphospho-sugar-binding domain-containing protein [Streptomyces armeniacus]AXK34874.1 hypothetical protein DVA86_21715 [Streptomyces armeniacus]
MRHFVLLPAAHNSTVEPALDVGKAMVTRGHRVTLILHERHAGLVQEPGIRTIAHDIDEPVTGTTEYPLPLIERELDGDLPDVLFYDVGFFALARLLAHRWSRPTVQLFPHFGAKAAFRPIGEAIEIETGNSPDSLRSIGMAFQDAEWHIVHSFGHEPEPGGPGADEFRAAYDRLPHRQALPYARVLVCHGELGSVMEALYYGAPVVIVPRTPEHRFLARHVTKLGLGVTVQPDALTARTLCTAVDRLVRNRRVRENAVRMSRTCRGAGGVSQAVELLERWLAEGHGEPGPPLLRVTVRSG